MVEGYIPNKISILIPSRKRTHKLTSVINNIIEMVYDIDNIEILIKVDDDDEESIIFINKIFKEHIGKLIKIVVSERGLGYYDLHRYFYELCEISTGQWIFLYNDDVTMDTKNFDLLVSENNEKILILHGIGIPGNCNISGGNWCFPIIHREIIKNLGHLTIGTPYIDGWMRIIGEKLNIIKIIPIKITHSIEMDIVSKEKETQQSEVSYFDWNFHIYNSEGLIHKDVIKLKKIFNI